MYMFIRIYTHTLNQIYVRVQFSVCGAVRTFTLRGRSPWPNEMRRRPRTSNGLAARLGPGALRRCGQLVPGSPAVLPRPRHSSRPPPRSQGCGPGRAGPGRVGAGHRCRRAGRSTGAEGASPRWASPRCPGRYRFLRSLRRRLRGGLPGGIPARLPWRLPQGLEARLARAHAAGAASGPAGRRALEALPRDRHGDDHHQGGKVTGTAGPPPARSRGGRAHQSGPKAGEPSRFTRQVDGDNVRWAREHVALLVSCSLGRGLGALCPSGGEVFSPFQGIHMVKTWEV